MSPSAVSEVPFRCGVSTRLAALRGAASLARLHGDAGAENEKVLLQNTLKFVKSGGRLIMPTSATCVVTSKIWKKAPVEAKERVFQICHPCFFSRK
jgi:hypothetical protein